MAREQNPPDQKPSEPPASASTSPRAARSLARRPIVWLTGIVVAALGATLTNALVPTFNRLLDPIVQHGPAVEVLDASAFHSDEVGDSVVFPASTSFGKDDLATLNDQSDPTAWLEARGGVPVGTVLAQFVLAGNRKDPVRIIDMVPAATCTTPLAGALFKDPPAGSDDSVRIDFDLDGGGAGTYRGSDGRPTAFFPARTISLAQGEQQVLIATASTARQSCEVRFRLTVLADGEREEIEIPAHDQPGYRVSAKLPEKAYDAVYLGGVVCPDGFVKASKEYVAGHDPQPCR